MEPLHSVPSVPGGAKKLSGEQPVLLSRRCDITAGGVSRSVRSCVSLATRNSVRGRMESPRSPTGSRSGASFRRLGSVAPAPAGASGAENPRSEWSPAMPFELDSCATSDMSSSAPEGAIVAPGCIVLPGSRIDRTRNYMTLVLLLHTALVVPVFAAFQRTETPVVIATLLAVDCMWLLDIVLEFNTAFVAPSGSLVVSRRRIAARYLKSWFLLDVVATLPLYLVGDRQASAAVLTRLLRLPRILRMLRVLRTMRVARLLRLPSVVHLLPSRARSPAVSRFGVLFLYTGIMVHVTSCLWLLTADTADYEHDTWVFRRHCTSMLLGCVNGTKEVYASAHDVLLAACTTQQLHDAQAACGDWVYAHVGTMYLDAMYWTFSTLSTVGYGDVSSSTNVERVISCFVMILGVRLRPAPAPTAARSRAHP